jgi:hypothetical protein
MYQKMLEATIARARKEGKYDEGIVDIKGTSIELESDPQVSPASASALITVVFAYGLGGIAFPFFVMIVDACFSFAHVLWCVCTAHQSDSLKFDAVMSVFTP